MNRLLKILYLAAGSPESSSIQRARALSRLGHEVLTINLVDALVRNIWWRRLNNYSGGALAQPRVLRLIRSRLPKHQCDLVWVDSGQLVGPSVIPLLRSRARKIVNYNLDDPTGSRDGRLWGGFKKAVPHYDALITVRRESEAELQQLGARKVLRVVRSFDEMTHRPRVLTAADYSRWGSEVVFVGSWMPERGPFLMQLVRRGVPLAIYGDHWQRAPEHCTLRSVWRAPALYDDGYAKAIQCSKVALGLLSKGNRDLHTQRSTEIPALGGLLCAERTVEHAEMFVEGREAVFWADATECADACLRLLRDESLRQAIARAGQETVWKRGYGNEPTLADVLARLN